MSHLDDWQKQGPLIPLGSHLQQPVDALRELSRRVASLLNSEISAPQERFIGQIVNAGPPINSGGGPQPDYSDARYWLKKIVVLGSQPDDNVAIADDSTDAKADSIEPYIVTAINMPEWSAMTHSLPTDGTQLFEGFGWWDVGDPQQKHYFFCSGGTLPTPQYQYMSYQGIAMNRGGFDFERAHPLL